MTYRFTIWWYSFAVKLTIAGGPISSKQSRLVPNIPIHDTWLRSRI